MASDFEKRAQNEADQRYDSRAELPLYPGAIRNARKQAFDAGAKWAASQEPTDAEIEAAALALHGESCGDDSCDGSDMGGFESDAHAALLAARDVRLGGDHA